MLCRAFPKRPPGCLATLCNVVIKSILHLPIDIKREEDRAKVSVSCQHLFLGWLEMERKCILDGSKIFLIDMCIELLEYANMHFQKLTQVRFMCLFFFKLAFLVYLVNNSL